MLLQMFPWHNESMYFVFEKAKYNKTKSEKHTQTFDQVRGLSDLSRSGISLKRDNHSLLLDLWGSFEESDFYKLER